MSEEINVYQVPEELKKRAKEYFTKADKVAYTLNYDYAIELYLDGISFWPTALQEGHFKLRDIAVRRMAAGGKKSGFGDGSKYKKISGKTPRDAMLKAEYLLSKEPLNSGYMADFVKAALDAGFTDVCHWMADVLFDANIKSTKPDAKVYLLLMEIYEKIESYKRAVQACQNAVMLKPKDSALKDKLRDLSATATMKQGKYDSDGDFRESIKDREEQEQIHAEQEHITNENVQKRAIAGAKLEYDEDPTNQRSIDKYVTALCATDAYENEKIAVAVLEKAYKNTSQFYFQQRANEIIMRQQKRQLREFQGQYKSDPQNKDNARKVREQTVKMLEFELKHYADCVENHPTDRRYKFELGKRYLKAKKLDEAIPLFQDSRGDPRFRTQSLSYIGQCFFYKKWYMDAIESFQEAFENLDSKESAMAKELLYNLGRAFEADGNDADALVNYRKVTQLDYNFRDARDRVDALRKKEREQDNN